MKKTIVAISLLIPTTLLTGCVTETVSTAGYNPGYVYSGTNNYYARTVGYYPASVGYSTMGWNNMGYGGWNNAGYGGWGGRGWRGGAWHGGSWGGRGWGGGGWHGR